MEKATVYRAISAPTALIAGALAIGAAYLGYKLDPHHQDVSVWVQTLDFPLLWGAVLVIVAAANGLFLYSDSRRRGEKFISSGMKMALFALLPSHLTALVLSYIFVYRPAMLVSAWITLHGLGLLATSHFSPRSMIYLGWAFLIAGFTALFQVATQQTLPQPYFFSLSVGSFSTPYIPFPIEVSPHLLMAITFGGFHLIYAACTWPRKSATY